MHESEAIPRFPPPLHVHPTLFFLTSRIDRHIAPPYYIFGADIAKPISKRTTAYRFQATEERIYRLRFWALPPAQPVGDNALSRGRRRCWLERAWLTRMMLQTIFCVEYHMNRTEVSALFQ